MAISPQSVETWSLFWDGCRRDDVETRIHHTTGLLLHSYAIKESKREIQQRAAESSKLQCLGMWELKKMVGDDLLVNNLTVKDRISVFCCFSCQMYILWISHLKCTSLTKLCQQNLHFCTAAYNFCTTFVQKPWADINPDILFTTFSRCKELIWVVFLEFLSQSPMIITQILQKSKHKNRNGLNLPH